MFQFLVEAYRTLTNPDRLIELLSTLLSGWWGYAALFAIVFSETGLLIGIFLPGDSLLFTVGVVAGAGHLDIVLVNVVMVLGAILGDSTGYFLGRSTGPRIFSRPDSLLFKKRYVNRTKAFYERHGGKTLVLARFIPVVRSLASYVAGVSQMPYRRFLPYSIGGGASWVVLMTTLGYMLGSLPFVRRNFDRVILAIVLTSFLPSAIELVGSWRRSVRAADQPGRK